MLPRTFIAALSWVLLCSTVAFGQNVERQSLKSLRSFTVGVDLTPDALRVGLSEDQVKSDVEALLRRAGLRVVTVKDSDAILYINVAALLIKSKGARPQPVAYASRVECEQWATLVASNTLASATTWLKGGLGVSLRHSAAKADINRQIAGLVGEFLTDHALANQGVR